VKDASTRKLVGDPTVAGIALIEPRGNTSACATTVVISAAADAARMRTRQMMARDPNVTVSL
jgi:hypothetical protein